MSLADRMDDALDEDFSVEHDPDRRWVVLTSGEADWALRKLRRIESEITEACELVNAQKAKLDEFLRREMERLEPQAEHWKTLLSEWHRQKLMADDKAKTLHLPAGTLTARKAPDGIRITDEDALLALLQEQAPEYVRTKVSTEVDRAAVKAAVLKDGEIIEFVEVVPGEVRFSVAFDSEVIA